MSQKGRITYTSDVAIRHLQEYWLARKDEDDMVNVKISGAVNIATSITAGKRIRYNNGNWVEDVNGYL